MMFRRANISLFGEKLRTYTEIYQIVEVLTPSKLSANFELSHSIN